MPVLKKFPRVKISTNFFSLKKIFGPPKFSKSTPTFVEKGIKIEGFDENESSFRRDRQNRYFHENQFFEIFGWSDFFSEKKYL